VSVACSLVRFECLSSLSGLVAPVRNCATVTHCVFAFAEVTALGAGVTRGEVRLFAVRNFHFKLRKA